MKIFGQTYAKVIPNISACNVSFLVYKEFIYSQKLRSSSFGPLAI